MIWQLKIRSEQNRWLCLMQDIMRLGENRKSEALCS